METIWVAAETPAGGACGYLAISPTAMERVSPTRMLNPKNLRLGPTRHVDWVEFELSAEFCGWIFLVSGGPTR